MTGVTVPAWTGILMLRELKSPESYFQAAFRVQSPWASKLVNTEVGGQDEIIHKEHCYVRRLPEPGTAPNRRLRGDSADVATERNDEAAIDRVLFWVHPRSQLRRLRDGATACRRRYRLPHQRHQFQHAGPQVDFPGTAHPSTFWAMEAPLAGGTCSRRWKRYGCSCNITDDDRDDFDEQGTAPEDHYEGEVTPEEKRRRTMLRKARELEEAFAKRFITRIPAFMYLTDDREDQDVITQVRTGTVREGDRFDVDRLRSAR